MNILQRWVSRYREPAPIDPEIALIMDELDAWLAREHELVEGERPPRDARDVLRAFAHRCHKVALVGSCRRGKETPGDVDVLYIPKSNLQVVEFLEQIADSEDSIKRVGQAWKCTVEGKGVDFIESTKEGWGLDLLMFTGSRTFNERVVRHAERRGHMVHNGRPVVLRESGYTSYHAPAFDGWSEEKILTHLGLEAYRDPRTREGV